MTEDTTGVPPTGHPPTENSHAPDTHAPVETHGANEEHPDDHLEHPDASASGDLRWVWREVRKRVFIKLPFSLGVAEALQAVVPIVLDEDTFVVGLSSRDYPLSGHLLAENVRNTIENILRQASRRYIRFEVIEGSTIEEWGEVKRRRARAQEAVIAMAEQKVEEHHYEDVLNQIIGEIRQRITSRRDRGLPQVRAQIMLDVVPSLGDATEMLFHDPDTHEARRIMARAIDRVAGFLDVPAVILAIEVERYRRDQKPGAQKKAAAPPPENNSS
jgi:hypothetical protein